MDTTTKEAPEERGTRTTMMAVRIHQYGGPEMLQYEEADRPKPAQGEVLVRVRAAGVNPVDAKIRQGSVQGWLKFALPITLGYDLSGVVEETGPGVTKLKKGDEVYGRLAFERIGAYAQYAVANEAEVALKPKEIDHAHAAAVPLAALAAWQGLFDIAKLEAGQSVLIHGAAGGVGHFAVQFARWKGAHVIGTAGGENVSFVRRIGAHEVVDYKAIRFEDATCSLDAVLDTIGGETQARSWQTLKEDGILVSTGGISDSEAPAKYRVRGEAFTSHPDAEDLTEIARLIDEGKVRPAVQAILPLEQARMAHEMMQEGVSRGKIVLNTEE